MHDVIPVTVFALVYAGMLAGRLPFLGLDRTGIALCGAIVLVATGTLDLDQAWAAVDAATIALLFGLMVVSAVFRLGGFTTALARASAERPVRPAAFLALAMGASALLSSLLANDIVCLAATPLLIDVCRRRGLAPLPFLIGLAVSANIGSAATLIGNPQNMLIGEQLSLSFRGYLLVALPPSLLALACAFGALAWSARGRWHDGPPRPAERGSEIPFDARRTLAAALVLAVMVALFLHGGLPRGAVALGGAAILLAGPRGRSRDVLALVDGPLILLFVGLFVVHGALEQTPFPQTALAGLADAGLDLAAPPLLFAASAVLSNLVSNVPAAMLLLPAAAAHPAGGVTLALASTLAGNLILVGSIANLIVVDQAARHGVALGWREHARLGVPITLASLAVAGAWLALFAW